MINELGDVVTTHVEDHATDVAWSAIPTAVLSLRRLTVGDVVFQPRKVDRSGLSAAVGGHVLIYLHKGQELADVAARCRGDHYVLVEDKLRILTAVKNVWSSRVTTVFVRQGHYACDPKTLVSTCRPAWP